MLDTKAELLAAARQLSTALRSSELGPPLRIRSGGSPFTTTAAGWAVTIASLGAERPGLELWLDKYLDGKELVYWAGYSSTNRRAIRQVVADVAEVLPDVPSLGVRDYRRLGRLYALKKVPRGSEQGRPLQEYYSQENFFGIFGRRAEAFDVAKFALFLTSTLRALPEFNAVDAYPKRKSEGRRAVGWHLRIERNHSLANSCKRRDGYRCQICRFHFTEAYGNLGERFAEAHHVVHLSKLKGPTENSAAHLRTVCSNCHRMLHRMQGSPSDIQRLKKLLRIRHVEI